jgi:alpha-L-rhamnosidase
MVAAVLVSCSGKAAARLGAPHALTVDAMTAPIGLGTDDVAFAWQGTDPRQGAVQRAYRLVVTSGATTVWDTGKVASAQQAFVPYAGRALQPDAAYRWAVQTWGASGGASPLATSTFETGLRDQDWRASWVRRTTTDPLESEYVQYTYVRKEAHLSSSPIVRARAYVSADQQYELDVNGQRAGKGEAFSFPDEQYYETLDVTHLLRAGSMNAFALLYSWQGATKGHPAGAPGVILQVSVDHADGTHEVVTTDGTWRARKAAWLPGPQRDLEGDQVDYVENVDGRAIPVGWDLPGFDDTTWSPVTVLGPAGTSPWSHLVPARTRIVEQPLAPVKVSRLASGALVADFGAVYAAVPTVTFSNGTAGNVVHMRAGYLLDPDGQVSTVHGTQHTDMSYSYVQRGGVESFVPFDYLGFRYFEVDDPGAAQVTALTRHVAVPDVGAATFSSSDATIDAVYELGRHSALFTAQEQFIDTPTREKGPWLWDGFNESETAMAAFGDQNETRKSLLEFAESQRRYWPQGGINKIYPTSLGAVQINEFTEIYPEWVWQYWMSTGDRGLLEAVFPALEKVAAYVAAAIVPSTGLVTNLPATSIYYAFPTVTRLNILGANVFRRVADIADALGRPSGGLRAQQTALTGAVNRSLTRADGTYVDGLDAGGAQVGTASQDTNAAAIVYGVAPTGRVAAVAAYVAALGMQAPPRTAGEVLEALRIAGRGTDVVTRLTDRNTDGWAKILAEGATFTWEVWQPSDANGDSMSHGWGSNVLVEVQRAILGVVPTAPGYATFTLAPPPSPLRAVSGRVPTPFGPITVVWQRAPSGRWELTLTVPGNATADVTLPGAAPRPRGSRSLGGGVFAFGAGVYDLSLLAEVGPG